MYEENVKFLMLYILFFNYWKKSSGMYFQIRKRLFESGYFKRKKLKYIIYINE